jgi:hypothetical protein
VKDHIIPLACGGLDDPANLQWQTTAEGEAKDKWERRGCARGERESSFEKDGSRGAQTPENGYDPGGIVLRGTRSSQAQ